jgi:hypothetical protein
MVRRLLVGTSEHAERRAHLVQQVPARPLDRRQSGPGLLGIVVHEVERHPGLHVDQRDVVAEAVVQVARHPQPLLAPAPALGLGGRRRRLLPALPAGAPQLGRGDDHRDPRQPPRHARQGESACRKAQDVPQHHGGEAGCRQRVGGPPVARRHRAAQRDHRGEHHGPERVAEREVGGEHRHHRGEDGRRVQAAHHEGGGACQQEDDPERVERAQPRHVQLDEQRAEQRDHADRDRQRDGRRHPAPPGRARLWTHGRTHPATVGERAPRPRPPPGVPRPTAQGVGPCDVPPRAAARTGPAGNAA